MTRLRAIVFFLAPAAGLFTAVLGLPLLYCGVLAFYHPGLAQLQGGAQFVGLHNYRVLFNDASFWNSVQLLALFVAITTVLELGLALAAAFYLDQVLQVPKWVENLLILPMFVIPAISGLTFRYLFDANEGILGAVYQALGRAAPGVLGDPVLALGAVVLQDIWRMWPFLFLTLYAAIKSLPQDPIEAIRLDGAGHWLTLRHVILPLLKRPIFVAVVMKVIESLKLFTEVYVMTAGGPGEATTLLSMYIVKHAFVFLNLGQASAAGSLLLGGGVLLALWLQRLARPPQPAPVMDT